jgi:hypothetical protein
VRRTRITLVILVVLLILEGALVISLRTLGWFGTGDAAQLIGSVVVSALPLLIALAFLAINRFHFGMRSLLGTMALIAIFLYVTVLPVLDYRSARRASMQLISESATLNEDLELDRFYSAIGLDPPPMLKSPKPVNVPPWLTPLIRHISTVPPDDSVRMIELTSDRQIRILADNWQRFGGLQSLYVASGVTEDGLKLLLTIIEQFDRLDRIHTNDVSPPKSWYGSLTNVRTLYVWGEGASRGTPFPKHRVTEIASLPNLEVLMVLGYEFNDADARLLANSTSIKRIILRKTAVTPIGESILNDKALNRVVYRN